MGCGHWVQCIRPRSLSIHACCSQTATQAATAFCASIQDIDLPAHSWPMSAQNPRAVVHWAPAGHGDKKCGCSVRSGSVCAGRRAQLPLLRHSGTKGGRAHTSSCPYHPQHSAPGGATERARGCERCSTCQQCPGGPRGRRATRHIRPAARHRARAGAQPWGGCGVVPIVRSI